MIDWRHWHNEPYLVGGLVFLGWLYAILAGPLRARLAGSVPFPRRQAAYFYSALLIFYLAVGSPLDQMGERLLFSAHMLQHQLLVYPAALLFLLGLPAWMTDAVLSRPWPRATLHLFTRPVIAGAAYTVVISVWHFPQLYDLALRDKTVHVVEHVSFFAVALLYWWPLVSPSAQVPRARHAVQMFYVLGVVIAMTPLAAYLVFSPDVLYPTYEYAPRLFESFTPMDDQLLAGALMKGGSLLVALATMAWSFYGLSKASEGAQSVPRPARR